MKKKSITEQAAREAAELVVQYAREIKDLQARKDEAENIVRGWYNQQVAPPAHLGNVELYTRSTTKMQIPNHVLIEELMNDLPSEVIERKISTSKLVKASDEPAVRKTLNKYSVEINTTATLYMKPR